MQDFARQAKEALAVYLARGHAALECLKAGEIDQASELLRKRNAAFHNFKAQDALALQEGKDFSQTEEARELWREIQKVEKELSPLVAEEREKAGILHQKIRDARQTIIRYRSGTPDHPRFEKTA